MDHPSSPSCRLLKPSAAGNDISETEWRGPFTFVQAADTQLGFMTDPTWGASGDGDSWDEEIALVHRLVRCVNGLSPRPRFVAICGDLVHALPEGLSRPGQEGGLPSVDRYTNESRWKRQNEDFKAATAGLQVPLVCVCGNHDVGDRPTPTSLRKYRSLYGPDWFSFWCGGMKALVLNSQLMNQPSDAPEEHQKQEAWLAEQLNNRATSASQTCEQHPGSGTTEPRPKHMIAFQHIPWFLRSQFEPQEGYFNMSPHDRERWLASLADAGVSKVFCGHYHRNAGATTDDGRLEVVVTSAVGRQMSKEEVAKNAPLPNCPSDTKSGMRLVYVGEDVITHAYHEFDSLEYELFGDQPVQTF